MLNASSAQRRGPFWPPKDSAVGFDARYVEDDSRCTKLVGGASAMIQSGLVSGGVIPAHREPSVQALWPKATDTLAVYFRGTAHDRQGQEEMFAVLYSLRFHFPTGQSR